MKKTMFITALVLAAISVMTAGTLAVYTYANQVQTDASAKAFVVSAASNESRDFAVALAPGERQTWQFTVANFDDSGAARVALAATISVAVPNYCCDDGVTAYLSADGVQIAADSVVRGDEDTVYTYAIPQWSIAGVKTSVQYEVALSWPVDSNADQAASQSQKITSDATVSVYTEQAAA